MKEVRKFLVKPEFLQSLISGNRLIEEIDQVYCKINHGFYIGHYGIRFFESPPTDEFELDYRYGLSKSDYEDYLKHKIGKIISFTRYKLDFDGFLEANLDVYKNELQGLVIVGVKLLNKQEKENFKPLKWFGEEITNNEKYKIKNLATEGIPLKSEQEYELCS